jgi:hypothetical protein
LEQPVWQITLYPPGPGAKLADFWRYFREHRKEHVSSVAVAIVAGVATALVLALFGLD